MKNATRLILILTLLFQASCSSQILDYDKTTEFGQFKYSKNDLDTIDDLIKVCKDNLPGISTELNLKTDKSIVIEVYPNQEVYNENIINPDFKNSPAISGNGKIQIVSPHAKIRIDSLKYDERLMLLVHEYIHILIDKLDSPPPTFIDEGIASYYSSNNFYKSSAKKYVKRIGFIPTIEQLQNHYNKLPAPDLFSFLFIDFLVQSKGKSIIGEILRSHEFNSGSDMNETWKKYITDNYY